MSKWSVVRSALRACALLALLACGAPSWVRAVHAAESIAVRTIYLTHPVGDIHRISIEGTLGGEGRLLLDTNRCGQNLFGDTTICTTNRVRPIPVKLSQLQVKDIKGEARRVFRVEGDVAPQGHRYYLVVPSGLRGNYRLAIMGAAGRVRVLSLEEVEDGAPAVPRAGPRPPDEAPDRPAPPPSRALSRAAYTAIQDKGVVTLRARGTHPGSGYDAVLERVEGSAYPPLHRLLQVAPPLGAEAKPTPFEVSVTFPAMSRVSYVHVEDAGGRHRIPVQRVGGR